MDRRTILTLALGGCAAPLAAVTNLASAQERSKDEVVESAQLRVIGVLAGAALQNAYLLLDVSSTSLSAGGLTADRTRGVSRAIARQLEYVVEEFERVDDEQLTREDSLFLAAAIEVCRRLQSDARALAKYAEKQTPADLRAFERTHKVADQSIRELFTDPGTKSVSQRPGTPP